ncbi:hypothetical protein CI109_105189 [Kwoniella shandongensis]|uniref:Uncharacterized protein n=1 Tax=Kwoniella shandongensis TaxID=1734106 RepID=A0A5M6C3A5_9TREE|nr:uncharacterized protein CI109_002031 [Kwoniella shandongensis]KAA5529606.1 hypothetical protein CI109_002031 [Kwoniella shandongensis]
MPSVLPNFLNGGSPPRSPHVERNTFLTSYFNGGTTSTSGLPPMNSALPRASHHSLRPTRRDILLCLLTLSFSYLLFSTPPSLDPVIVRGSLPGGGGGGRGDGSSSSRYRLPSWSSFLSSSPSTADETCIVNRAGAEVTFGESVRPVGFGKVGEVETIDFIPHVDGAKPWDEGEEEAEDDELEGMATIMKGHAPGWTLFERLYIFDGSFYVVTDERLDWPELRMMTSTGLPANNDPGNSEAREPKGKEIIFITPFEAMKLWGPRVYKMDGMTFLFNDGQFIDHYYHFAAELLMGAWRTYASLDEDISSLGETSLPAPKRMWFLHQTISEWRDKPRFNPTLMFSLFPSISILYPDDFADLTNQTRSSAPKAYLLERALLADRSAAFRGEWTGSTARTVASSLHVGTTSNWWWEPIRRQVLRYSGVPESIISRNLEGYGALDPIKTVGPGVNVVEPLAPQGTYTPVITYISRQNSRRRLTKESHEDLVKALEERSKKLGWELVIVEAERMTKEEQFALAGRTTIMLGVHGNGLTHLLWMPATPRSAVIEMFYKGGFARDYQWTAHALGIRHFAVQHDTSFTAPNLPKVDYPEGFQGTSITVVGKVVADLIEDRLAGKA